MHSDEQLLRHPPEGASPQSSNEESAADDITDSKPSIAKVETLKVEQYRISTVTIHIASAR